MKKRQINNIANGYMKIQLVIDEKQKKLSDKYENLKLSHNRKYKLLENIENNLTGLKVDLTLSKKVLHDFEKDFQIELLNNLLKKIRNELNSTERMKGF